MLTESLARRGMRFTIASRKSRSFRIAIGEVDGNERKENRVIKKAHATVDRCCRHALLFYSAFSLTYFTAVPGRAGAVASVTPNFAATFEVTSSFKVSLRKM